MPETALRSKMPCAQQEWEGTKHKRVLETVGKMKETSISEQRSATIFVSRTTNSRFYFTTLDNPFYNKRSRS
jgi:hypothetical protein